MRCWLFAFVMACRGLSYAPAGANLAHDTDAASGSQDPPVAEDTDRPLQADPDAPATEDTDPILQGETDVPSPQGTAPPEPIRAQRIVIAGDSWSNGFVHPLRDALDDRGMQDIALSWDTTARAGSTARHWRTNEHPPGVDLHPDTSQPRMLSALHAALDQDPPADVLLLVLSGNDLNREAEDGLGTRASVVYNARMQAIEQDLEAVVQEALDGRPHLNVVLVGYDYFHYEFLTLFGLPLEGFGINGYNEALIDLESRKRAIASRHPQVWWSHHLGLLQHTHGDTVHVPFSRPNPLTGYPEYDPGVAPAPGVWPSYDPMPGGFFTYPAPLDLMPDGIHPSAAGHRFLSDHLLDQGLEVLLLGTGWQPISP